MGVLHTTNRKKLAFLGGLVLLAALVLRRRGRRDAVEIEIDERRMESVAIDEPPSEGVADDEPAVELESIEGVGPAYASRLRDAGIADGADLVAADVDELAAETGIGERRIRGWTERVGDSGDG